MAHLKVNDISMYYETYGAGEPLVLIAGFTADHTVWSEVVTRFKDKYQVIVFDNRGAGQTDVPDAPYSIEQMANDVAGLCAELGIKKAHFIGNSMGGFILQALIHHHPELVKSAIISHSSATTNTPFRVYVEAQLEMFRANVPAAIISKAMCAWVFSPQFMAQPGVVDFLIQIALVNPFPFTLKGYEGQLAALTHFDSRPWLQQFNVPILVLSSDQDLIFREPLAHYLVTSIPGARYYCFSECGHLPQVEYPDQMVEVVHEFIESVETN